MSGVNVRRRTALVTSFAIAAGSLLTLVPAEARPAQTAPGAEEPGPQDLAATPPMDTAGIDPVLDDLAVEPTPAIRRADDDLAAAAADHSQATLRWVDAERTRAELAERAGRAGELAASAQAAHEVALIDQTAKERRLAERQQLEDHYRATLEERRTELRKLVAGLFATAPEDRYAVLGSFDDITEADRRDALRERGSDLQLDRLEEARRPWAKAHEARLATKRQVARARFVAATTAAEAAKAADERDRSDEVLRAADAAVGDALAKVQRAREHTLDVLTERRAARLEATVEDLGIPLVALHAYWRASALAPCRIPWWVIAGIGRVESGHGSAHGSSLTAEGDTTVHILGIPLDGRPGTAAIPDSDGGRLDDDARWDRAVGPMQFIPGTWGRWAADGNADETADPHNIYDAAGAAARYLCFSRGDLLTEAQIRGALLAYNRSVPYGTKVLAEGGRYRDALELPDIPATRDEVAPGNDQGN